MDVFGKVGKGMESVLQERGETSKTPAFDQEKLLRIVKCE
jgi:hypothetical protein